MTQLPRSRLSPIRIVLFDAFDTLVRPKGQPYRQYVRTYALPHVH